MDRHLHLLKARLFPASITRPQSAFTFDILDNFLIDALECKTSAMSFYQKLRHFSNNAFPHKIPDCYCELMQVSCIWRDLMNRIWFGFGHEMDRSPGPGDLALYCPTCPQPSINLPLSWKDSYDDWLVMQRYVVDGNFTVQHMKMKTPEDDVLLVDGKGYMVTEGPYETHITESKSSCSNHRAMNAANVHSALIIYDVSCQWSIHFHEQFHLSAHKLPCFARFSLNFITGAGHVDGEILETLWAPFNKISPTVRSMTLSHRKEVLDDHMRDSNWRKLVGIGKSPLLQKC
ncbi:hypothetical protein F4604DRAFT_1884906 [Suillus subluteus]|nr:hypothetical protein F4604DRAFT_1884906 [Suillus subluteus]